MTISDETLMAYADGEADAATCASVESAMREDPDIAARVGRHRAMREAMKGAFSAVLEEPVPERLIAAARGRAAPAAGTPSTVVDLAGARATAKRNAAGGATRRWQPFAVAASLLLGLGLGYIAWHGSSSALIEANSSGLVAGAKLADALSTQLSNDRGAGSAVVAGLSFRDKTGEYCRTFSLSGAEAASGLACRNGARWKIKALAQSTGDANSANFRTAASALSPAIRAAVEDSIDGEPLDREAETAARAAGWSAPAR
jgi:hypothetical protein